MATSMPYRDKDWYSAAIRFIFNGLSMKHQQDYERQIDRPTWRKCKVYMVEVVRVAKPRPGLGSGEAENRWTGSGNGRSNPVLVGVGPLEEDLCHLLP